MAGAGQRILVVDDEPLITQSVCEALETLGFRPCAAFNGTQAMEEIGRERPDLVVLDLLMPLMDGFEVLKRLRADPGTHDVPVIVLTALESDGDVLRAVQAGATMYLTKPVEVAKLTKLVTAILGTRPAAAPGRP